MTITKQQLESCFAVVDNVNELYFQRQLDKLQTVKSVDDLSDIVAAYAGRPVEFVQVQLPAAEEQIKGFCIAYPDKYEIGILSGLNHCWHRFVLCKELFHVFLDSDEYHNTDIIGHLEQTVHVLGGGDQPNAPAVSSEQLAEIAAMEFLFPFSQRSPVQNGAAADFAGNFEVPRLMVEKYCTTANLAAIQKFR